jgi:glucose/arabinose dehydrogenase
VETRTGLSFSLWRLVDVLVDTRGYIYVTDKQWGLWILRYTGPEQPAPTDK